MKNKKPHYFDLANFSATKAPLIILLTIFSLVLFSIVVGFGELSLATMYEDMELNKQPNTPLMSIYYSENLFVLIAALIIGFVQFRFLDNKSLGLTTFSFPKNRKKIFNGKTVIPLITMVAVSVAVKTVAYIIAGSYLGVNTTLTMLYLKECLALIEFILLGFSAAVIASVFCGRTIETILGGYAILSLPNILFSTLDTLLECFLYGYFSHSNTLTKSGLKIASWVAPTSTVSFSEFLLGISVSPQQDIPAAPAIFWIILCITALYLCKRHFIKGLKVEQIGFKTINKVMTFIITVTLSLNIALTASYGIYITKYYYLDFGDKSVFFTIVLTALCVISAYVINSIITSSIKLSAEKVKVIAAPLAIIILTVIFGVSGGLGYATRIPDSSEIALVEVTSTFNHLEPINTNYAYPDFSSEIPRTQTIVFSTEKDIEVAKAIHESTLSNREAETAETVNIAYVLKNGSVITRSYSYLSEEASSKLLNIWKTDEMNKLLKDTFFNNKPTNLDPEYPTTKISDDNILSYYNYYDEEEEKPFSCLNYKDSSVGLFGKDAFIADINSLLDENAFNKIKTAIYKDITTLTTEEWFKPTETYGGIVFSYGENYYDSVFGEYYDEFYEEFTEEIPDSEAATGIVETVGGTEPEEELYIGDLSDGNQLVISVTAEMKNTVKVLKDLGLFELFKEKEEVNSAYIANLKEIAQWYDSYDADQSVVDTCHPMVFYGGGYLGDDVLSSLETEEYEEEYPETFAEKLISRIFEIEYYYNDEAAPVTEVTDKAEIKKLISNAHNRYLTTDECRILIVEYDYKRTAVYIIPG